MLGLGNPEDTLTIGEQQEIRQYIRDRLLDNDDLINLDKLPGWLRELEDIRRKFADSKKAFLEYRKEIRASLAIESAMRRDAERKAAKLWQALQYIFAHAGIDWFEGDPPTEKMVEKIKKWKELEEKKDA